ncbi:MAG: protein transporter tim10 [Alyxoria varia]|nr:MAG: protein transporter tim10 [Alyxoria varia]
MSFLFGAKPPSSEERLEAAETEIAMVQEMYNKLTASCLSKCVPKEYREGDLNKGESVCLDRCVSKYMQANMKISEKMQANAAAQGGGPGAGAGGLAGFGR